MRKFINGLEEGIISLLLASMTLLVFMEVVMRFGFNEGIDWAQEMTLHLSAWMVLFGASYGIKVGSHIGVDALVRIMPSKARHIVTIVAVLLALVYCGLFIKGSWVYLKMVYMIGIELEDIPIPKWTGHSILFIGFVLLAIRLLQLLWQLITGKADGFKMADEAKESLRLAEEAKRAAAKGREGDDDAAGDQAQGQGVSR